MGKQYFNSDEYIFTQNDTLPAYVFTLYSNGSAVDLSGYPAIVVKARFREKGAALSLAVITCTVVNATIGQFQIANWPAAVSAAETGRHELEIEVDYLGDATQVQTCTNLVLFKVLEEFGDTA